MKKKKEILIVGSNMREAVRDAGFLSSGDLVEAVSDRVHNLLEAAIERARCNDRATVRPCDL